MKQICFTFNLTIKTVRKGKSEEHFDLLTMIKPSFKA